MMKEKVIIQKLASEHNLPLQKVEEAVYYQFKYVADVIRSGKFESIRLPFLGKFHVRPGRLRYLNERLNNS
jgi:nucleoid DNA-binding protein